VRARTSRGEAGACAPALGRRPRRVGAARRGIPRKRMGTHSATYRSSSRLVPGGYGQPDGWSYSFDDAVTMAAIYRRPRVPRKRMGTHSATDRSSSRLVTLELRVHSPSIFLYVCIFLEVSIDLEISIYVDIYRPIWLGRTHSATDRRSRRVVPLSKLVADLPSGVSHLGQS